MTSISYEPPTAESKGLVRVKTENGIEETHDVLIAATGLGKGRIKIGNKQTQDLIAEKVKETTEIIESGRSYGAPQIMTVDDFIFFISWMLRVVATQWRDIEMGNLLL